jgi:hypothetical protein
MGSLIAALELFRACVWSLGCYHLPRVAGLDRLVPKVCRIYGSSFGKALVKELI